MRQEIVGTILRWDETFDVVVEYGYFIADEHELPETIYIMEGKRVIESFDFSKCMPWDREFLNKAAWLIATSDGEITTIKLGPIDDTPDKHFSVKASRVSILEDGMVIDEEDLFEIV